MAVFVTRVIMVAFGPTSRRKILAQVDEMYLSDMLMYFIYVLILHESFPYPSSPDQGRWRCWRWCLRLNLVSHPSEGIDQALAPSSPGGLLVNFCGRGGGGWRYRGGGFSISLRSRRISFISLGESPRYMGISFVC